jgi:uncharacterized protein YydD (DUF2326 family)
MIHQIYSDLKTFKTLTFQVGLNILLSKKSAKSTDKDTRNRAGKTSLIKIIHFLMGGDCDPDSIFRSESLNKQYFGINFNLKSQLVTVKRAGENSGHVVIGNEVDYSDWMVKPAASKKTGQLILSNDGWKAVLGKKLFGLNVSDDGANVEKFGPTFRMLFPYFARRQEEGGFIDPVNHREGQYSYENQIGISFLLDFDWAISREYQVVRDKESDLKVIKKTAKKGNLGDIIGTVAELRTRLTILQERYERAEKNIRGFKILPQYRELEEEVNSLTKDISLLSDKNTMDRQVILQLSDSLSKEVSPGKQDLKDLYDEVGIVLPDLVAKRFDEVQAFHESILANRELSMRGEIDDAKTRIEDREKKMIVLDTRRSEIMAMLNSHKALDQYHKFEQNLRELEVNVKMTKSQFDAAQKLEEESDKLDEERAKLKRRLKQDFKERENTVKEAILYFEEVSSYLYSEPGSIMFKDTDNGPEFEIKIHGKSSKGITNMQIFCLDMLLMKMCSERERGPGFLVHDSHLFDGVDERQVAKALEFGAEAAIKYRFQYIVTCNEDCIPAQTEFSKSFNFEKYVLPVTLTDDSEEGGLFGIRFS